MMKLGCRAHDFGRSAPELLSQRVAEAGFETVQLALTKAIEDITAFRDVTPALLERTRRAFETAGVEIAVLGCYVECGHSDRTERLRQVEDFKLGLIHAKELGVGVAGTETTRFPVNASPADRESAYQSLKDSVLRMAREAERLEVDIGIEPVADHTLHSPELTARLLEEVNCSRLKIILDPVNLILAETVREQESIYAAYLEAVGRKLVALHLKDIVFEGEEKVWRNIGQGIVSYKPLFEWLRVHRPDIPLLREHVKPESASADLAAMGALAGRLSSE